MWVQMSVEFCTDLIWYCMSISSGIWRNAQTSSLALLCSSYHHNHYYPHHDFSCQYCNYIFPTVISHVLSLLFFQWYNLLWEIWLSVSQNKSFGCRCGEVDMMKFDRRSSPMYLQISTFFALIPSKIFKSLLAVKNLYKNRNQTIQKVGR